MGEEYTTEEVIDFLKVYKEIPVSRLRDVELNTRIRYEDKVSFKKGGKLKEKTDDKIIIISGNFKWPVKVMNIKRVWIEDERRVELEEEKLEEMENIKDYLLSKYKEKLIVITKSKKETKLLNEYLRRDKN